jgi:membrane-bound lytic murein transglycosylase MltF
MTRSVFVLVAAVATATACGAQVPPEPAGAEIVEADSRQPRGLDDDPVIEELRSFDAQMGLQLQWTGDLDEMVERGYLRALVSYSKTHYFLDGAQQRGLSYEALQEFEKFLNGQIGRRRVPVQLVILPVGRDELIPALEQGYGDLVAANLTITPERLERVDFSVPTARGVHEVVVTGPDAPPLETVDDLAGRAVWVRRSSSYWHSLEELSVSLEGRGLDPIDLRPAEEYLEDEDLLELVAAGMLPWVVVDEHKATFWAEVFDGLTVRDDLAVRTGGEIGWAFRRDSPQLAEVVNAFVRKHGQGTLFGNVVIKRYLEANPSIRDDAVGVHERRFQELLPLFEKYAEMYGFDPMLLTATAYQESQLDQSRRSRAGAVGVMQIKPSTAADPNVGITGIDEVENNIHAGTKYLAFIRDRYFSDPDLEGFNPQFFSLAAYNAGPARIRQLREEAAQQGLDPDVWFGNVEHVAARRIGSETVRYVSNITKYAFAYLLVVERQERVDATLAEK